MMYLILALDQQRLVHGDMTRRNMLYKQEKKDIIVVLSDFVFTGELSATHGYHPRIGFPNLVRFFSFFFHLFSSLCVIDSQRFDQHVCLNIYGHLSIGGKCILIVCTIDPRM